MFSEKNCQQLFDMLFVKATPLWTEYSEYLVSYPKKSLCEFFDRFETIYQSKYTEMFVYETNSSEQVIPFVRVRNVEHVIEQHNWFALVRHDSNVRVVRFERVCDEDYNDLIVIEDCDIEDLDYEEYAILLRHALYDHVLNYESDYHDYGIFDGAENAIITIFPRDYPVCGMIQVRSCDLLSCSIYPPVKKLPTKVSKFSDELCDKIEEIVKYIALNEIHALFDVCLKFEIFHLYLELLVVLTLLGFSISSPAQAYDK